MRIQFCRPRVQSRLRNVIIGKRSDHRGLSFKKYISLQKKKKKRIKEDVHKAKRVGFKQKTIN